MIESKLKAKNANAGQLFRPGWVSSAECVSHSIEKSTCVGNFSRQPSRKAVIVIALIYLFIYLFYLFIFYLFIHGKSSV